MATYMPQMILNVPRDTSQDGKPISMGIVAAVIVAALLVTSPSKKKK
jgi:hypothetical protein